VGWKAGGRAVVRDNTKLAAADSAPTPSPPSPPAPPPPLTALAAGAGVAGVALALAGRAVAHALAGALGPKVRLAVGGQVVRLGRGRRAGRVREVLVLRGVAPLHVHEARGARVQRAVVVQVTARRVDEAVAPRARPLRAVRAQVARVAPAGVVGGAHAVPGAALGLRAGVEGRRRRVGTRPEREVRAGSAQDRAPTSGARGRAPARQRLPRAPPRHRPRCMLSRCSSPRPPPRGHSHTTPPRARRPRARARRARPSSWIALLLRGTREQQRGR
jgi:hypothetical protein